MKPNVFISYSHEDRDWSRRFADSLRRQGMEVFLDDERISVGTQWRSQIKRQLEQSTCVLTVVDPTHGATPNTLFEAGMAIGLGKPVFFVVPPRHESDLSTDLKITTYIPRGAPDVTAREVVKTLPVQEEVGVASNLPRAGVRLGERHLKLTSPVRRKRLSAKKK